MRGDLSFRSMRRVIYLFTMTSGWRCTTRSSPGPFREGPPYMTGEKRARHAY